MSWPIKNKYSNIKCKVADKLFDSKKERARYLELQLLSKAGEIKDLTLQPEFRIEINNTLICKYRADFEYYTNKGEHVVEDVKSPVTAKNPVYRIKNKLVKALYGIEIKEV